jgi:molybdopterin biosynthesis enzyme
LLVQDGYAVVSSDPPQEYEVAFESLAGTEQQTLQPGTIAYISTGKQVVALAQNALATSLA